MNADVEERIIETMIIERNTNLYDDSDFVPIRQSLYTVATAIPEYDDDIFHQIVWRRPSAIVAGAEYFAPCQQYNTLCCEQGSLPDDTFLGALLGTCVYPGKDLIENIFASRPDDFKTYGIYTCRFYVEGEWVDVITDTNLPCIRDEITGACSLAYGRSGNPKEMWVSLVEKAYAKAVGSYEAIEKVKAHEALLHLTGGSIQQMHLHDETVKDFQTASGVFKYLQRNFRNDTMILLTPAEFAVTEPNAGQTHSVSASSASISTPMDDASSIDEKREEKLAAAAEKDAIESMKPENMFHAGKMYSVIACRDVGGFELVLLHNPWPSNKHWRGSWSDKSTDWDLYPEMQQEFDDDPSIPWTRHNPNGYFWMTTKNLAKYFNLMYLCKLFPNDRFNYYCVTGEWRGKCAGGTVNTVRDKLLVAKDAAASRVTSIQRSMAASVVDGDPSWFNNPQYRVHCAKKTTLYVSVLSSTGLEGDGVHVICATVVSTPKSVGAAHPHLWDISTVELVATTKPEGRAKGQEASLWSLELDANHYYHIVVHTVRRGLEASFIVRMFATEHIVVEKISNLTYSMLEGAWTKHGDLDSTGGALKVKSEETGGIPRDNGKWCQNPQYHLEVVDPYGREEIHMKIVVRRTDKGAHQGHHRGGAGTTAAAGAGGGGGPGDAKAGEVTLGMVICKADMLEDNSAARKKNQPRQNAVGELIMSKESTLKKKVRNEEDLVRDLGGKAVTRRDEGKRTVLRKTNVDPNAYFLETSYTSKTDCTVYFPKIPRSWMPNGLMIIPSVSERGVRGTFDIEVYCSEPINLTQLPDSYSRSIASGWVEGLCGGSHLCTSTWKKNPKFQFALKHSSRDVNAPCRVRITLSRANDKHWRALKKKDALSSMIGFYIFISRDGGDMQQIYESTFVPSDELSTDANFMLAPLPGEEEYVIMPTTYGENVLGAFVLSIMSEHEFLFKREKFVLWSIVAVYFAAAARYPFILSDNILREYIDRFNLEDEELYPQHITNDQAFDFLSDNIPLLHCPEKDIERIYYFRWWTFRKHIKLVPEAESPVLKRPYFVITEFLPKVSWSGLHNTISCAASHHFRDGRWLHNQTYLDDYALFWAREGNPRQYSFWFAASVQERAYVTASSASSASSAATPNPLITQLLPGMLFNFEAVKSTNFDASKGLYFNTDNRDGMEFSVGGGGKGGNKQCYRPSLNSYMIGEARALGKFLQMRRQLRKSEEMFAFANQLKVNLNQYLWDNQSEFYKVLPRRAARGSTSPPSLVDAKELVGYTPWYFSIPDAAKAAAWRELRLSDGFRAPFGLTTCEQRHPQFEVSYDKTHECRWNGPVWPYATSMTLIALMKYLQGNDWNDKRKKEISFSDEYISKSDFYDQVLIYARSHSRVKDETNETVNWIDENINPYTGDWISRTLLKTWVNGTWSANKGGRERGKDYNHSVFMDLVISGLVGLSARGSDVLSLFPLLPDGRNDPRRWKWFCLDQLRYRGRYVTIVWDEDGSKFGLGGGLKVYVNKQLLASSKELRPVRVKLPPL